MSEKPEKQPATRQTRLFWTDYAAFVCVLGSALTGIILWLFIDKGPGGENVLWGWRRHEWGDLHLYFSLAFIALLLVHFVQHWRWIRTVTPRQTARAGAPGFARTAVITALTLGLVSALFFAFRGNSGGQGFGGRGAGGQGFGGGGKSGRWNSSIQDGSSAAAPAPRPAVLLREAEYGEKGNEEPADNPVQPQRRRWRGGRGGVLAGQ